MPVVGCSFSLTTQFRVKVFPAYEVTFGYLATAGLLRVRAGRGSCIRRRAMGRWSEGRRLRRGEAYGHSIVRYSCLWSSMRPASSMRTLTPAVASWKAAMPPAAPLPTTMTSHFPEPGLIAAARRRDSSVTAAEVEIERLVGAA